MDVAKSLFGARPHEGYSGKEDYNVKVETAVSDDEDAIAGTNITEPCDGPFVEGFIPTPGGPFSALTPSMWPQDILSKLGQVPDDPNSQPEYRFDEFGFRVEEEDGPEQNSNKLLGVPLMEDAQERLKWLAHLEFSHNNESSDLTWEKVDLRLPRTDKLCQMVREGIPHSLRPQLWMRLSDVDESQKPVRLKENKHTTMDEINILASIAHPTTHSIESYVL